MLGGEAVLQGQYGLSDCERELLVVRLELTLDFH